MLYTLLILLSGIYIGQEYTIIPSIKILSLYCLNYLNSIKNVNEAQLEQVQDQQEQEQTLYTWFIQKVKFY